MKKMYEKAKEVLDTYEQILTTCYEYEEAVNEITLEEAGFGKILATPEYMRSLVESTIYKMLESNLDEVTKDSLLSLMMDMIHNAVFAQQLNEMEMCDSYNEIVQETADKLIKEHKRKEE